MGGVVAARRLGLALGLELARSLGLALRLELTLWRGLSPEDGRRRFGFGRFGLACRLRLAGALVHPAILGLAARLRGGPRGAPAQCYDHEPDPQ